MSPAPQTKTTPPEANASTDGAAVITRILLAVPAAFNGEVFTFVDSAKHQATMEAKPYGVYVETKSAPSKQGKNFLVPWSNVAAVLYPPPAPLQRFDAHGRVLVTGQVGTTSV
jgi:hypothetical protein